MARIGSTGNDPSLQDSLLQFEYVQTGYWLAAGGMTLFFYDWLLCLDREIQYLWRARWSFGKVLFVFHRYSMMVLLVSLVYGSVKSSTETMSAQWCKTWDDISYIGTVVVTSAIQGTFVLRVCALYRKSRFIIAFIIFTYASCSAAMLALFFQFRKRINYLPDSFTPLHICVRSCNDCIPWTIYIYVPSVILDTTILILTVRRSFIRRSERKAAPIFTTLFKDGITYFAVATISAFVNILFFIFAPWALKSWMIFYLRPLLSSMATRLILNLHGQVHRNVHYSSDEPMTALGDPTLQHSTMQFAPLDDPRDTETISGDVDEWIHDNDLHRNRPEGELEDGMELKDIRINREGSASQAPAAVTRPGGSDPPG